MIDWLAFFLGGLLGSAHCVGMCGGIAVTVGGRAIRPGGAVMRQVVYSIGRIVTYAFLGAMGGFAGLWLARHNLPLIHVQRVLSILAGVIMIGVALSILGWLPKFGKRGGGECAQGLSGLFGDFVSQDRTLGAFLAGLATGFLPCGLVYAFLAKATAGGDVAIGAASMACFGLGTVPAMMLVGCGGAMISHQLRGQLFRVAACFVLAVGGLTIYRGWSATSEAPCAACAAHDAPSGSTSGY